jgi:hypothetical protein
MGGKNMGYVTGPLQLAAGVGATALGAPEIGIPLMTAGVGQTAGTGIGGSQGGMMGELAGGAAGGLGEGFMGMGPLGSSLGGTQAGQGLQSSLQGTSLGKWLGMQPPAGSPGSSVAAGVVPTAAGQPGAFPAPGAPPVPIDPKTGQMIASLQGPPGASGAAATPATPTTPTTPAANQNQIETAMYNAAANRVANPPAQQQQTAPPLPPTRVMPASQPSGQTPLGSPIVSQVPQPLPPTAVLPAGGNLAAAGPAGAGPTGPTAPTPQSQASALQQLLRLVGGSLQAPTALAGMGR